MILQIFRAYRERQRVIDMNVLWPQCKLLAPDLDHAKAAFAVHAFNDTAWTKDYSTEQLVNYIDRLT